ncbi:MAG TPA: aminotransferase class I/II-fold pyridoxal phosphate-dependent enzyme [Candidatus Acidoferrales bacterium]|nr:aminotransferase class I/II-fold pyridoxal phosphate-dependent enzyme [Candidatus Acidoferrales bacterium]
MNRAATDARPRVSEKAGRFTESVIREMTRLALQHGAINLAQGFPDFPAPAEIKEAAREAIAADVNQYAITWGARDLRETIAAQFLASHGVPVDPEREITVCCGSTEAMISSMLAVVDPGDEVVIFEPFYENYGPDAILSGARPRFVRLRGNPGAGTAGSARWSFDPQELASAFGPATRAIIVNTPNNPTGKVFTREELEIIRDLCVRWNALAITDEIYEHILYDGARHVALASLDGMRERTITINGLSKTYSVTGWRVGWAIAAPDLSGAIRKVHDFLTVGAAAPLQAAGALALRLLPAYYERLAAAYRERRDFALEFLERAGFRCFCPAGAYYIMTDISNFKFADDLECARFLVEKAGVAVVPGSSFYQNPADGARQVRFAFCKQRETLDAAAVRLARLPGLVAANAR